MVPNRRGLLLAAVVVAAVAAVPAIAAADDGSEHHTDEVLNETAFGDENATATSDGGEREAGGTVADAELVASQILRENELAVGGPGPAPADDDQLEIVVDSPVGADAATAEEAAEAMPSIRVSTDGAVGFQAAVVRLEPLPEAGAVPRVTVEDTGLEVRLPAPDPFVLEVDLRPTDSVRSLVAPFLNDGVRPIATDVDAYSGADAGSGESSGSQWSASDDSQPTFDDVLVSLSAAIESFDGRLLLQFGLPVGAAALAVAPRPLFGFVSTLATLASDWLGRVVVAGRFGREDRSDLLGHETRAEITEIVTETPGITLSEVTEQVDTPLSTIRYHLRVLEDERVVHTWKHNGNRRLYPIGAEPDELDAALEKDSTREIIRGLYREGGVAVSELADAIGRDPSTVSHHLSRLADDGIVVKRRDGRRTITSLDPAVKSQLEAPSTADLLPVEPQPVMFSDD